MTDHRPTLDSRNHESAVDSHLRSAPSHPSDSTIAKDSSHQATTNISPISASLESSLNNNSFDPSLNSKKVNLGNSKVTKWQKRDVTIPANPHLKLSNWQPSHAQDASYSFAKLNKKLSIPIYSDQEYAAHLQSSNWSREETDYLMQLCSNYDLRFIVIADRYDFNSSYSLEDKSTAMEVDEKQKNLSRTSEDLKERYYQIQRTLIQVRRSPEEDSPTNTLLLHPYDAQKDKERKQKINKYEQTSTSQDLDLELALASEYSRIESMFRKHSEDAIRVIRLYRKQQKYFAALKLERQNFAASKDSDDKKDASDMHHFNHGRANSMTNMMMMDLASKPTKTRHPAVYSRSHSRIYTQHLIPLMSQANYVQLFSKAFKELQIEMEPQASLVVSAAMTELKADLILLHEMQRLVGEKAYEVAVLQQLHASLLAKKHQKQGLSSPQIQQPDANHNNDRSSEHTAMEIC